MSIYFSLCGPVTGENSCGGGGVCYKNGTGSGSTTTNIGSVTHGPHVSKEDGGMVVSYQAPAHSLSCSQITTTIVLICTPNQVGVVCSILI